MKNVKKISFIAIAMLLAGCGNNTSESLGTDTEKPIPSDTPTEPKTEDPKTEPRPTEEPITTAPSTDTETDSEPETDAPIRKTLANALTLDYTNSTAQVGLSYKMEEELEATTEYFEEYHYNGYTIVNDFADKGNYLFYHDYNNESYLYFAPDSSNPNPVEAWLNKGVKDAPLGIENTYFSLPLFLSELDATKAYFIQGLYIIDDEAEMAKLNASSFGFAWMNECSSLAIAVDNTTGYITQVMALPEDPNDDDNFVRIKLDNIGTTVFQDSLLPTPPSSTNVMEYWQYKGWDGPKVDKYPTSLTLTPDTSATVDENRKVVLDIEKEAQVTYAILPDDADKRHVSLHVQDETIASLNYDFGTQTLKVTALKEGETEVWIRGDSAAGEDTGVESNHLTIKVNPLKSQNLEGQVYGLDFTGIVETNLGVTNTLANSLPVTAKANKAKVVIGNSDLFAKKALILNPCQQGGESGAAYAAFDFDDQEVSSVSFYYGYYYSGVNTNDGMNNVTKIAIETSADGETWTEVADITSEVKANISTKNLKLMERSFAPASKVRVALTSNMIGKNLSFAFDHIDFMADENCHDHTDAPEVIEVTSIDGFALGSETIKVGKSTPVSYLITPANATDPSVVGVSSNEAVAKFESTEAGLVLKGLSAGTAEVYLRATNGVESAKVTVTVSEPATLDSNLLSTFRGDTDDSKDTILSISGTTMTVKIEEETFVLTYDDKNEDGYYMFYNDAGDICGVKYSTYNSTLSFSSTTKLGTHTINAHNTHDGFTKYIVCESITLSVDKDKYLPGDKGTVSALFTPSNTTVKELTYTSSDESILKFNMEGSKTFTCVAPGTATITATNEEGVSGTIEVTVSEKTRPSSITVTSSKTEISTGEKVSLSVAFDPADCDDKDITYTSSDETIATVNKKGEVTGLAAGEVDITVSLTSDPTISGTIHITVSGEAAVIDADYCGTYSGQDDNGLPITVEVSSDGTIVVTNEDSSETGTYTFSRKDGSDYYFKDGDGTETFMIYFSNSYLQLSYCDGFDSCGGGPLGISQFGEYISIDKQ